MTTLKLLDKGTSTQDRKAITLGGRAVTGL